jgi:predicted DNA-binding protein (UPF0251 family)
MNVTVEELELAIRSKLQERQGFLDQANACAGAIKILQAMLEEANGKIVDAVVDKKKRK